MTERVQERERRANRRVRPRTECELFVGARRFEGWIEDASHGGVFVRTPAEIRPGTQVRVRWAGEERFAVVVYQRPVPSFLRWVSAGGVGLRWIPLDRSRAVSGSAVPLVRRWPAARSGSTPHEERP